MKYSIAVLASGSGSNFQKIAESCKSGYLESDIKLLIHNNEKAKAKDRAIALDIDTYHISAKTEGSVEEETSKILEVLEKNSIDLVVLAGYMKKLDSKFIQKYKDRIINIHPALLPKFGGQNYYGMKVHRAVFECLEDVSGATIHLVDEVYDNGKILEQGIVDVSEAKSAEEVAALVLEVEHKLYSDVLKKIEEEKIEL